jgi:hypothetical protein
MVGAMLSISAYSKSKPGPLPVFTLHSSGIFYTPTGAFPARPMRSDLR